MTYLRDKREGDLDFRLKRAERGQVAVNMAVLGKQKLTTK